MSLVQPDCSASFTGGPLGLGPNPVDLGNLPNYHFYFADGSGKAKIQSASPGYYGDIAVNGIIANEDSSGSFAYAGTIYTNDVLANGIGKWQDFVDANSAPSVTPSQAFVDYDEVQRISDLNTDFINAWNDLDNRPSTPAYTSLNTLTALSNHNFQDNNPETIVIDITGDFNPKSHFQIQGDAGDIFVLRWDKANNYAAQVKFQDGGAIAPVSCFYFTYSLSILPLSLDTAVSLK